MRLHPLVLSALLVLVGWGTSCSAPVASRPVPPVKTRPVQEVPLSTGAPSAPSVQTEVQSSPQGSEAETHSGEKITGTEGRGNEGEEHEEEAKGIPRIVGKYFEAYGLHEDEIGGHHEHGVVTLAGINLFVLRTSHVYKNPVERAKAMARLLEESLHVGDPLFILGQDGGDPAIYSVSHHGGYPRLVVTVTKSDASGYSHRSSRTVSQEELGQWWLGWLENLVAVLFLDKPPSHLPVQRAGEALTLLGQRLRDISPQGPYTQVQVVTAVEALGEETRNSLQSLAFNLAEASAQKETPWGDGHH